MNKKGIVIFLIILGLGVITLSIIGFMHAGNKTPPTQSTYTDPSNGKQLIENAPYTQSSKNNPDTTRPAFISFSTLTDRGLSKAQTTQVENAIYSYSSQKTLGFTEVSLVTNSIETTPPGSTDPGYFIKFAVTVNRSQQFFINVTYSDFNSCTTQIYKSDKTTLLFTQ